MIRTAALTSLALLGLVRLAVVGPVLNVTPGEGPPNVVLIIADDIAWTDYGFMGHDVLRTPNLDRLARESMVWERGYVPTSVCRPSLATMISGLYPHEHGITGNDPPGSVEEMMDPAVRAMMAEIIKPHRTITEHIGDAGYLSHQSGKWWEGNPEDHGFTDGMTVGDLPGESREGDRGLTIGREGIGPVVNFVERTNGAPFFLWFAPLLPHTPHNPPEALLTPYLDRRVPLEVSQYWATVAWLDQAVGKLLDYLDRTRLAQNTAVIFLSDNGWVQPEAVGATQLVDTRAKGSPFDAGIRTPVMIRWPGQVAPGRDDTTLVGGIDIAPTILDIAGLEQPPEMSGVSLLDAEGLAQRDVLHGAIFSHTAERIDDPVANLKYRYAVHRDGHKIVVPYEPNRNVPLLRYGDGAEWMRQDVQLYDLIDDPFEIHDLAPEQPELVADLLAELTSWWDVYE